MKNFKHLFTALLLLFCTVVNAHDFEVNGIYYNITNATNKTVAVTYKGDYSSSYSNEYTGNVVIPESVTYNGNTYSVTSIGESAFQFCSGLTSVVIGNSVTSIGSSAFSGCSGLTSIVIPNSVTSIGNYAFSGCSGLTSIVVAEGNAKYDSRENCNAIIEKETNTLVVGCKNTIIPNSVTSIGGSAFSGCSGLTSIEIPNSVTSIGENAFYGTAWYNNQPNGVVYAGNFLYKYKGNMPSNTSIKINEGTLGIAAGAFYACSGLTSIEIPNSVTSIGYGAFSGCSGLTSIEIPNSVTSIEYWVFENCSGLTSIEIPSSVTSIGSSAFSSCSGLTSIEIPNSVTSIGKDAFARCSGLTSAVIPNSVTSIEQGVFWECTSLKNVVIGNEVTSIGMHAFLDCSSLVSIEIPYSVESIGEEAFKGCTNLRTVINHSSLSITKGSKNNGYVAYYAVSVTYLPYDFLVGDFAFAVINGVNTLLGYLGNDTEIILPDNYNGENYVIGAYAFYNNTSITSIVIGNSVTSIADNAFEGCTNLKKVELNTTTVENWFSGYTSIKEIVTGNSVTSIVGSAFSGCTNLASLTVGSKVASIGTNAFNGCGNIIKVFWLGNTPPAGYEQLSGKINYVANNQYTNLTGEVVVSQFLSSKFEIDGTVYVPTSLSDRTCCIVDYDILSDVSDVAIEETVSYQGVSLKVQDINPYSFYGKENLETVLFEHNGGIGTSAFEGCTSLKNIEIPHSVTFVGDHAFRNCTRLNDAKINDRETVLPLGVQLFANSSLETLYIDGKISYKENNNKLSPFSESSTLKSVVITNAESNIYDYEFYNCTALESAVVGDGVKKIGRWAFSNCLKLTDFVFGSNLEEIGEEAFSDCSGLVQITGRAVLPPVCGAQALDDINKWTCNLYVPAVNLAAYKGADQWKEFLFVEELVTTDNYVTYKIDGEVYKTLLIKPGERIIVPAVEENKEYYTFSGWNLDAYISAEGYPVMPDEDIVVEGSFIADKFMITYIVDGEVYATDSVAYGSEIVLIDEPAKEGYTFSGWSEVPATMPAEDITVEGTFSVNTYVITYLVDGEVYATDSVAYGSEIVLIDEPAKEGYTFSGWSEVPETMPAEDIVVEGTFVKKETGIEEVQCENGVAKTIYDLQGRKVTHPIKGIYIVNGRKVVK